MQAKPGYLPGYLSGLFAPKSCEAASPSEDAAPLRCFACAFRRLRFSRSASFKRSLLESFVDTEPGPLSSCFSSIVVDLFECLKEHCQENKHERRARHGLLSGNRRAATAQLKQKAIAKRGFAAGF